MYAHVSRCTGTCMPRARVQRVLVAIAQAHESVVLRSSTLNCVRVPYGVRCASRESGPVLYVRSSAQVVHVQYVFDTVYGTYRYIYFELIFIENRCNPFDAILLSPKFPLVDSPATRHTWRPRGVPRAYACSSGSDRWVPSSVTPGTRPCRPVCPVYAKTPNSLHRNGCAS